MENKKLGIKEPSKAVNVTTQNNVSPRSLPALSVHRETVPEWKAFRTYFEASNGFSPTAGDSRVEELFNYYLVGAWDKETGQHAPSVHSA